MPYPTRVLPLLATAVPPSCQSASAMTPVERRRRPEIRQFLEKYDRESVPRKPPVDRVVPLNEIAASGRTPEKIDRRGV